MIIYFLILILWDTHCINIFNFKCMQTDTKISIQIKVILFLSVCDKNKYTYTKYQIYILFIKKHKWVMFTI